MTVEREFVEEIASAEINDEGGVDVMLFGTRGALLISEARDFAAEIIAAANEAEQAVFDAINSAVESHAFDVADSAPAAGAVFGGGDQS